jgi:UrcA family protein
MVRPIAALFLSVLTASALVGGASAATAEDEAGPSITVKYSRADLATEKGAEILYARLKRAAKLVCPETEYRDLVRFIRAKGCYETALANAVERVKQPRLTALHAQQTNRHVSS